ncbi:MAG: CopD family protein [Gammaproteobacteria bacterium]
MFLAADLVVVGLRALTFVGLFFAVGTWMFVALWQRDLAAEQAERIRNVARGAAVVALIATVFYFVLTPAYMAGSFGSTFDPSLEALQLQSSSGPANIARVVGLALLALSLDRAKRLNTVGAGIGAALAVASFAFGGHTAIHPLWFVLGPLLLLHLAAAAFWFGALWPLYVAAGEGSPQRAGVLLAGFTRLALRIVPLVFLAGVGMSVVFVRSLADLATPYGAMLIAKTVGFGACMALAGVNKARFAPAVSAGDEAASRSFRRIAAAEWTLIVVILFVTAVMTSLYAPEHLEGAFGTGHSTGRTH